MCNIILHYQTKCLKNYQNYSKPKEKQNTPITKNIINFNQIAGAFKVFSLMINDSISYGFLVLHGAWTIY